MACIENRVVRAVVSLDESATFREAAHLMAERGIGSVGVRRGAKLVGLVTERDLVAAMGGGAHACHATLGQIMRTDAPSVSPQATDRECALLMRTGHTRHLAVKEGGEIVGVISMLDLVDLVVEDKQWSIDQLESYIRGGRAGQLSQPIMTLFSHGRAA
ncbi:CBS domain-containing protein [Anaeromyxobacter terrae]|uniref:CBS domain-containing protein n=1 Tax=Anaeromyxobacter terrae TaxID=2925406 RepID=UPI001F5A7DB8|nr:CBS domain-containing protein [Anaeromyxobacter sp. SG22]